MTKTEFVFSICLICLISNAILLTAYLITITDICDIPEPEPRDGLQPIVSSASCTSTILILISSGMIISFCCGALFEKGRHFHVKEEVKL